MEVKTNKISIEQFFGIVPIDETLAENDSTIVDLIAENNTEINNANTRKSDDYYENLKEKEGPVTSSGPYEFSGGSDTQTLIGNEQSSGQQENSPTGSFVQSVNGQTGAVIMAVPPTGCGMEWYSDTPPDGWFLQNGQAISRTTYADLFAILGTKFGNGDGFTTFNLPNRTKRVPVGAGDGLNIGDTGGQWNHKHSVTVGITIPAHYHGIGTGASLVTGNPSIDMSNHTHTVNQTSAGSHTHSISLSGITANHTHAFSGSTNNDGAHDHNVRTTNAGPGSGTQRVMRASTGTNADVTAVGTDGSHSHGFSGNTGTVSADHTHNLTGMSDPGNHTHSVSLNGSNLTHTHTITGTIGLVTGGVNGNVAQNVNSAATDTTEQNQQYIVVRWIIKF